MISHVSEYVSDYISNGTLEVEFQMITVMYQNTSAIKFQMTNQGYAYKIFWYWTPYWITIKSN
jgi:hypothetical protein